MRKSEAETEKVFASLFSKSERGLRGGAPLIINNV